MSEFSIFARGIVASKGFEEAVSKAREDDANGYFKIVSIAEVPENPSVDITVNDASTGEATGFLSFTLYRDEAVELGKVLLMMFDYDVKK